MSFSYYSTNNYNEDKLKHTNYKLTPRLVNYLKKKIYYKKNHIISVMTPEQEFQITDRDKELIRKYFDNRKQSRDKHKQYFPSKAFRNNDPRVPKNIKNDFKTPINMGMFVPNKGKTYYDGPVNNSFVLDARDFSDSFKKKKHEILQQDDDLFGFNLDDTRFDPRTDPKMMRDQFESKLPSGTGYKYFPKHHHIHNHSKYNSQYRITPESYGDSDRDSYKRSVANRVANVTDPRNKYIISDLSRKKNGDYQNNLSVASRGYDNNPLSCKPTREIMDGKSYMDTKNKIVVPTVATKAKDLNTYGYTMMKYAHTYNNFIDRDVETALTRGMPDHTRKSYGLRNPEEHYFDFLPDDFVSEQRVWHGARGGVSTRRDNKAIAEQQFHHRGVY